VSTHTEDGRRVTPTSARDKAAVRQVGHDVRQAVAVILDDVAQVQRAAVIGAVVVEVLLLDGTGSSRAGRWVVQVAQVGGLAAPRAHVLADAAAALRIIAAREADA
jgi:hypothetical protein